MKYRRRILAGGVVLAIAGIGSAVALQPAPPPKPPHLSTITAQAPKPQFQPQVTTYTDPPPPAAQTAPTAATDAAAAPAAATPSSGCSPEDQQALNIYKNDLALWTASRQSQGQSTDPGNPFNLQGHEITVNIETETEKGCQ